jgi:hypothetical protein
VFLLQSFKGIVSRDVELSLPKVSTKLIKKVAYGTYGLGFANHLKMLKSPLFKATIFQNFSRCKNGFPELQDSVAVRWTLQWTAIYKMLQKNMFFHRTVPLTVKQKQFNHKGQSQSVKTLPI